MAERGLTSQNMSIAIAWRLQFARRLCASSTPPNPPRPSRSAPPSLHTLFRQLSRPDKSIGAVMRKWLAKRNRTSQEHLFSYVRELRRFGNPTRALHLFDWMARRGMPLHPGSRAVRIDLLAKTAASGVEEAERYFSSLPPHAKTYSAMLTAYAHCRMEDQSLSLFSRMREFNFLNIPLPYNNLMLLYLSIGKPQEVPELFRRMKDDDGITPDRYSYSMLARSYDLMRDLDSFERVVREVQENPPAGFEPDWNLHASFASMYVSFGMFDKAEAEFKSLEEKMDKTSRKPYHFLITYYAGTGNKDGVDRIWESLKKQFPKTKNGSYLMMLLALAKLEDIDAIERCFKDWQSEVESGGLSFYIRIANVVIGAYLKKDMLAEAQAIADSCVAKGHVDSKTVDLFLEYYLKDSKLDLAWNWFEKGVDLGRKGEWKPSEEIVNAFVKCFEESADRSDQYELFRGKLKEIDSVGIEIKENEAAAIA